MTTTLSSVFRRLSSASPSMISPRPDLLQDGAGDDLVQLGAVEEGDVDLEHETSSCASGAGRCLRLDRVLRREHEEGCFRKTVLPLVVTEPSCMVSRSADWVFGVARLISSAAEAA